MYSYDSNLVFIIEVGLYSFAFMCNIPYMWRVISYGSARPRIGRRNVLRLYLSTSSSMWYSLGNSSQH